MVDCYLLCVERTTLLCTRQLDRKRCVVKLFLNPLERFTNSLDLRLVSCCRELCIECRVLILKVLHMLDHSSGLNIAECCRVGKYPVSGRIAPTIERHPRISNHLVTVIKPLLETLRVYLLGCLQAHSLSVRISKSLSSGCYSLVTVCCRTKHLIKDTSCSRVNLGFDRATL